MMSIEKSVVMRVSNELGIVDSLVRPDMDLVNDLGADSLDLVEIVMAIEAEFDIEIVDEDFEKCVSVNDIVSLVESIANGVNSHA